MRVAAIGSLLASPSSKKGRVASTSARFFGRIFWQQKETTRHLNIFLHVFSRSFGCLASLQFKGGLCFSSSCNSAGSGALGSRSSFDVFTFGTGSSRSTISLGKTPVAKLSWRGRIWKDKPASQKAPPIQMSSTNSYRTTKDFWKLEVFAHVLHWQLLRLMRTYPAVGGATLLLPKNGYAMANLLNIPVSCMPWILHLPKTAKYLPKHS